MYYVFKMILKQKKKKGKKSELKLNHFIWSLMQYNIHEAKKEMNYMKLISKSSILKGEERKQAL